MQSRNSKFKINLVILNLFQDIIKMLNQVQHDIIFKFLLVFLTFNFSLFSFNLSPAQAQQVSLSLSPTLTELAIKPGHSALQKYKLTNLGDPTIVKIRILPFEPKGNLGNIKIKNLLESPIRFELDNELITLEEPFFLKNANSIEILLNVLVSEGTPPRDYYFSLLAESQAPPTQEGTSNVRAKISVGSNLLLTVTQKGQIEIKPKISLFEVIPKNKIRLLGFNINLFDSFEKIPLVLLVENKGKNLLKPRGEIILRGPFWQTDKFEIKPQNVLAGSQRTLTVESNRTSNPQPQTPNSLTLSGFYLGKYNLSANISFGDGTPALYSSTSFFVVPIKIAILIIATILLGLVFRKRLIK
ncbi:hypothetical protein HY612_00130 [Candidatus Roizmanbacteria bacterium]|nr:hypothetical protein [Candidatus Roizmanbacteria bacterium]